MATKSKPTSNTLPLAGDVFRCQKCGMELEIKEDCKCQEGTPRLECCGQPMTQS